MSEGYIMRLRGWIRKRGAEHRGIAIRERGMRAVRPSFTRDMEIQRLAGESLNASAAFSEGATSFRPQ